MRKVTLLTNNNDTIVKLVSSCSGITVAKDRRGSHPKHKKIDRQAIYDHIQNTSLRISLPTRACPK
nr:unnamed protein product [Callosobruchus analis]